MQTFLPYASFELSAAVLDDRRLGKQRVETLQIMKALIHGGAWSKHPATNMWRGYEFSLLEYQYAICVEWHLDRGFNDTCLRKTMDIFWTAPYLALDVVSPFWLGDPEFHLSHQSNLVRKDKAYYAKIFPGILPGMEYVWPV